MLRGELTIKCPCVFFVSLFHENGDNSLLERNISLREGNNSVREPDNSLRKPVPGVREPDNSMREPANSLREENKSVRGRDTGVRESILGAGGRTTSVRMLAKSVPMTAASMDEWTADGREIKKDRFGTCPYIKPSFL